MSMATTPCFQCKGKGKVYYMMSDMWMTCSVCANGTQPSTYKLHPREAMAFQVFCALVANPTEQIPTKDRITYAFDYADKFMQHVEDNR